ncbi:hypothetical protein AKO1_010695 [Acrasis kona]|uniref:Defective in cullin neddylation protein n=1 Tax=Acrasis kona TaxID=1008807 RepID=A0AAW2ZHM9_9EUKA
MPVSTRSKRKVEKDTSDQETEEMPAKKIKTTKAKKTTTKKASKNTSNEKDTVQEAKVQEKKPAKRKPRIIEVFDLKINWQCERDYSGYENFEQSVSDKIEKEFQSNNKVGSASIKVDDERFEIDFSNLVRRSELGRTKRVKRVEHKNNLKQVDVSELDELFNAYESVGDQEIKGEIGGDGIMKFAEDVGVDPEQVQLLVLFWKLGCKKQYVITKEEFTTGMAKLGMETLDKIKTKLPSIDEVELKNKSDVEFTDFYNFCFFYVKSPEQKSLPLESAVPTWRLILPANKCPYIEDWIRYMETENKKSVTHDTWKQFNEFRKDKVDFEKYDPNLGAYPTAIDDFVQFYLDNNKKK